jgi:hypothetical protein
MKRILFFALLLFISFDMLAQLQLEAPTHDYKDISTRSSRSMVLYDQLGTPSGGSASQIFTDYSNCVLQTADDFVISGPNGWTITDIDAVGTWGNGSPQPYLFTVVFYEDASGLPGTLIESVSNCTYVDNGGLEEITLTTPVSLAPGHYWISVMVEMPFNTAGQWFWAALAGSPSINNLSAFQDPCDLIGGATTWSPTSTQVDPGYTQASFALYGSEEASVPVSNWAIVIGLLLIGAFIVVRYRTRLA